MDDIKLFENNRIRSLWDEEKEEWLFSIVDVVGALTESDNPRDYWYWVKQRMSNDEKSELSTICRQLKLRATDGKLRVTDVADLQGIFRLILSLPLTQQAVDFVKLIENMVNFELKKTEKTQHYGKTYFTTYRQY